MSALRDLPQSFRREQQELEAAGLERWEEVEPVPRMT